MTYLMTERAAKQKVCPVMSKPIPLQSSIGEASTTTGSELGMIKCSAGECALWCWASGRQDIGACAYKMTACRA